MHTDSLVWETEQALQIVGPERVGILHLKGRECRLPDDVWSLEYDLSRHGIREAKRSLDLFIRRAFSSWAVE